MKSAAKVYQEGCFVIVDIKNGTHVDMSLELAIYRQRLILFEHTNRQPQRVIYVGRIGALDFAASRYACGEHFARITCAKVLVLENVLNRTYANIMLKMNQPRFPVYICTTLKQAKQLVLEKHPPEAS